MASSRARALARRWSTIEALSRQHGIRVANVFHAGDGNLHPLILYDGREPGAHDRAEVLAAEIIRLCIRLGGSITGEHGIGLEKRQFLGEMYDAPSIDCMRRLRLAMDPTAAGEPRQEARGRSNRQRRARPASAGAGRHHLAGMTHSPATIDDLRHVVVATPRLSIRGGGTKPGLSGSFDNRSVIDMSGLAGITEHTPEECTFSALAGTPTADIERRLAAHGQYLPFDPPLMDAGATIGGAVAAGASGSCRYRYGGIRDFLIGARIVDGRGELITAGGKVVKNAAGLLLHQAMVGSCGRFGVLAELTFKVFPRAKARATVKASASDLAGALEAMDTVRRAQFELEAIDIEAPSTLLLRLGGAADALPSRVDALRRSLGLAVRASRGSGRRRGVAACARVLVGRARRALL